MTFRLEHHNKILTILESFNQELLNRSFAYFGGGTLIALDFEEYCWSKDVDLIIVTYLFFALMSKFKIRE
ncbi:MAG: hypothetical protein AAGA80_20960 [Cyanobacteria bacterium P01_F01_bin.143]